MPAGALEMRGDAGGERVAADGGEVFAKEVSCSLGVAGGGGADDLDVVAFPVHLLANGTSPALPVRASRSALASPKAGSALTARRSAVVASRASTARCACR